MEDETEKMNGDLWNSVVQKEPAKVAWALRVSSGKEILRTIRLNPDMTYIGRMAENHVVLDDPQVSRSHARISVSEKGFVLEDQESENGVFVNGNRVAVHPLRMGDKITIGAHLLEVVAAESNATIPVPAVQLEEMDAEWRMNQTVNITGDALESLRAEGFKARKATPKKTELPTFDFSLKIGETSFEESVTFDRGRKREEKDGEGNFVEVRICIGKWVLFKKIPV
jgi:pSer/pThr/pTyr-binding forkhead associated (FHA) protein